MKTIIFAILVLVTSTLFSQTQWETQYLNGTVRYSLRMTGLDTTTAGAMQRSIWLDISLLDKTRPIWYFVRTTGDDVDTMQTSIEQLFSNGSTNIIDTAISLLPSNGEAMYTDTLFTQTGVTTVVGDIIRIRVNIPDLTSSTSNGVFEFTIFGQMAYLPPKELWKF